MIKILYFGRKDENDLCEYDYIMNDILPKDIEKQSTFLFLEGIRETQEKFDVFVYSSRDPQNYPWGYMPTYEEVLECVLKTQPKIIIQLSDEFYFEDLQVHNNLGNYCELFLRQYHFDNYSYTMNTIQMPLGYCNGIEVKSEDILSVFDRKYTWSFVGEMKSDRWDLVNSFNLIEGGFSGSSLSKSEMTDIYMNSIFAPSGRGNSSLNCFRLYETSMMGCIPVVVGPQCELDVTFLYEENPPWIFSDNWENAVLICQELLSDKNELQKLQNENLKWWKNRIGKISKKIEYIFNEKTSINYKSDQEKLKNFPAVHFISTIDSDDRRSLLKNKFNENGIKNITPHIFKRYEEGDYIFRGELMHKMTGPGRGPLSSHLRTIKGWYYGTDEPYAFFCEDDISFETVKYWNFTWEEFFNRLPEDWECVQLCWVREKYRNFLIEFRNRCWCDWSGCAYLISRKYAKKVIENYYYGNEFVTDIKGEDLIHRPEWAKIPVIETVIFSSIGKVYGFPLFVEDVTNCHTTWRWGSFNEVNTYSYFETMGWWKGIGQFINLDDIFVNIGVNINS
jgi:hypothetical protein